MSRVAHRPLYAKRLSAMPRSGPMAIAGAHQGASLSDITMAGWTPYAGSADADLLDDRDVLVPRSRDMGRNNGLMSGANQTLKDNIIGAQLRLSAMPEYRLLGWEHERAREWGNKTEAEYRSWGDTTECDAGRSLNMLGLTLQGFGGAMGAGDHIAVPLWLPRPDARWSTRLLLVESDRMDTPPYLQHRADIRRGILQDRYGAPVGYWISKVHPGDSYAMKWQWADRDQWEYIPAFTPWGRRRLIHLHDKERTGQSRGKPIVSAVMREFHMAGKYQTTELQAAIANSLVAAFIESGNLDPASTAALFGEHPAEAWASNTKEFRAKIHGGAIINLPVGAKLSSFTPGRPNAAFEAFMLASLRHIAAGLNIPYELLVKDFSKTNYSSARAALLEAWRYFHGRRRWLMDTWLRPIYELWLEEAINAGRVEAPDYYNNRYAYGRCKFIFSGRGWVDPVKEASAAAMRMDSFISTLEAECAEQGGDWEEILEQRAYEAKRMADLRLQRVDQTAIHAAVAAQPEDPAPGHEPAPADEGGEGA